MCPHDAGAESSRLAEGEDRDNRVVDGRDGTVPRDAVTAVPVVGEGDLERARP
jgi:hypothetical protein